jgi:hypothetical protein
VGGSLGQAILLSLAHRLLKPFVSLICIPVTGEQLALLVVCGYKRFRRLVHQCPYLLKPLPGTITVGPICSSTHRNARPGSSPLSVCLTHPRGPPTHPRIESRQRQPLPLTILLERLQARRLVPPSPSRTEVLAHYICLHPSSSLRPSRHPSSNFLTHLSNLQPPLCVSSLLRRLSVVTRQTFSWLCIWLVWYTAAGGNARHTNTTFTSNNTSLSTPTSTLRKPNRSREDTRCL